LKVLITDPVDQGCIDMLQKQGILVDMKTGLPADELKDIISDYSALIVRSGTKVTAEVIEAAAKLKVIGRAGTGVDNIDVDVATRRGIIVMNTPGGNTISAAEHTISMLLALSRNIPQATQSLKEGRWDRKIYMGVEVYGKTLGIIGLGRVGREVALRAGSFGMKLIGYDPFISDDAASKVGVKLVDLDEIFSESDYITLHTPLTSETKHLISEAQLERCKTGVRIINCARGGVVDEKALLKAIKSGRVAGAALDVYEDEPPSAGSMELLKHERVICTPHLGASTREAQVNVALQVAQQVADVLTGGAVRNAVNLPSIDPKVYQRIEPYLNLAEKMGSLQSQLGEGHLREVSIEYRGDVLNYPTSPITSSVLKGIFAGSSERTINLVNAPFLARERGVKVNEIKSSEHEDFSNLITVTYCTSKGKRIISGTIFGKNDPRIVRMDECHFDAYPEGDMLVCGNVDVPGVIGRIGTILGDENINIARMTWGREKSGGRAVTLLNVDSPIPDQVLEKIVAQKHILWAKRVRL